MGKFKCLNDFIKYGMNLQKLDIVIRAVKIFRLYHQNCLIFEKISARHNSRSSKILFVIIGEGQIFKSHQENCPISAKILPRDDRASSIFQWYHQICLIFAKMPACDNTGRSNFQITSTTLFLRKLQLVIIWEVQIFKSLQQNCFLFEKISARDNRASSNFQNVSTKLFCFWENFSSW